MSATLHVYIEGLVHGVGFRYATRREAVSNELTGWVKNLPDGRVEALFQGDKRALERMLLWCKEGPVHARVARVDVAWEDDVAHARATFDISF